MSAPSFSNLRENLCRLKEKLALRALKTGTEIEDMGFEEIAFLGELSKDIVPLYVKIGGPEARNDIRALVSLEVDGIIAPMIESPYALQKFIESLRELLSPALYRNMRKGINIETIGAVDRLDEILAEAQALSIDQITAARTDLSASMSTMAGEEEEILSVNDDRVMENCALIVKGSQDHGLQSSVGGKIEPWGIADLLAYLGSDFVNSRHMLLSSKDMQTHPDLSPAEVLVQNLNFECSLYSHLAELFPARRGFYEERIFAIKERAKKKPAVSQKSKGSLSLIKKGS